MKIQINTDHDIRGHQTSVEEFMMEDRLEDRLPIGRVPMNLCLPTKGSTISLRRCLDNAVASSKEVRETTISLDEAYHGTTRLIRLNGQSIRVTINPGVADQQTLRIHNEMKTFMLTKRWERNEPMLYTIAVVFFVLWLAGLVTSHTMGGLIDILLVVAIMALVFRLSRGQNVFIAMK